MTYINKDNNYGSHIINEKSSKFYCTPTVKGELETDYMPQNEMDEMRESTENCNNQIQYYNNKLELPRKEYEEHQCNKPNEPEDKCKKDCDDDWECEDTSNCCQRKVCHFDSSKANCVCAYMNIIYSEEKSTGTTLFSKIDTTTAANFVINTEYKSTDCCCTPCVINTTSLFTIESTKITIKNFSYTGTPATSSVLIDGTPVLTVVTTPNGVAATVNPNILNPDCSKCNKGTNASLILNQLSPWSFIADIRLCGKVTTNGNTCKFRMSVANVLSVPATVATPSTFVAPDLCLPPVKNSTPITIDVNFSSSAQLLNQVITPTTNAAGVVVPVLTGSIMLNTSADMEVLQNTKVCFNGIF